MTGIEAASMEHRVLIGGLYQAIFAVGSGLLGLTAYFVRDWRMLQLAVGIPMIIMAVVTWYEILIPPLHFHDNMDDIL